MNDIQQLLDIMASLRAADGCPWDREQTFASIVPYTIEEAYEVADAVEAGDLPALKDELGDLLLQVVYHARMAEEIGAFTFGDVVAAICDKMVRRHPHIFGDAVVADAAAQTEAWERMKAAERARAAVPRADGAGGDGAGRDAAAAPPSLMDGVPRALPALVRAVKLQQRAARLGFDWPDVAGPLAKLDEEIGELRAALGAAAPSGPSSGAGPAGDADAAITDEVGDVLFTAANLARKLGLDAEQVLRRACAKFERRFRALEAELAAQHEGGDAAGTAGAPDLDRLEALWQKIKRDGQAPAP